MQRQSLKLRKTSWLLGNKSNLTISDKNVPYKIVIKTIWAYGVHVWGRVTEPLKYKLFKACNPRRFSVFPGT